LSSDEDVDLNDDDDSIASQFFIDCNTLISEVEKCPAIFNKKSQEYSDRNVKEKMWNEVCHVVIKDWNRLSGKEKQIKDKCLCIFHFKLSTKYYFNTKIV